MHPEKAVSLDCSAPFLALRPTVGSGRKLESRIEPEKILDEAISDVKKVSNRDVNLLILQRTPHT